MNFESLVSFIEQTHERLQQQAFKAVNISLTIRNWLIGFYIVEFEQKGEDRAVYGEKLFSALAQRFKHIKGIDRRAMYRFKEFYKCYPQIKSYVSAYFPDFAKVGSSTPLFNPNLCIPAEKIVNNLSYTHIEQLLTIQDPLKRSFYESSAIKGTWSVKELKRQISTLAYERVGLSNNTKTALEEMQEKIEPSKPVDAIKSVFLFDFLGLKTDKLIEEKDLETALLNHLQDFISELGLGFCFEYRQKRILIDDEYFFIDLVFYHRVLKCHVVIELKVDAFKHEYLSQLNTYVAYYNAEVKRADDNPAIGILLCTEKGQKLVEYATAGMDKQLFVAKYLVKLPQKEELEAFILKELKVWK